MPSFILRPLAILALVIGLLGPVPQSIAEAADPPTELTLGCALKTTGAIRAVEDPAECKDRESMVEFRPGPVLLCVENFGAVFVTSSFSNCQASAGHLTVPAAGMTYFCVGRSSDLLRHVADPGDCQSREGRAQITPLDDAPTLVSSTPSSGAEGVATTTSIDLTFSEAVTAAPDAFTLACAGSSVPVTATGLPGTAATLTPASTLPEGSSCLLTIQGTSVSDTDSNDPPDTMAADATISFTTDSAPTVTATNPADGAIGVATTSAVSVSFSEPVDVSSASFSLTCAASPVGFTLSGSGTATVTLTPAAELPATTACAVTVNAASVHDSDAGDPPDTMAADLTHTFTTVDAAPTVTATTPVDGTTDVGATAVIEVTFSEPVTVADGAFSLVCAGSSVATTVVAAPPADAAGPATSWTVTPSSSLPPSAACTLTVQAAGIEDTDGVAPAHPAADHVISFTVVANAAPTGIALSPAAIAENSAANTLVGTLSTTDPDAGDSFTYTLVTGVGDDDNALFLIDGAGLRSVGPLDAETSPTRTIRILSTDAAGATVEASFVITVTDVNEAPGIPTLTGNQVNEHEPAGTTVGTLAGTDPDAGQSLTFTVVPDGCGGTYPGSASFVVTGTTLQTTMPLNHATNPAYTICIRVTDTGSPALSTDQTFTIEVLDVNDAPVATADGTYVGVIGNTLATLQRDGVPGPRVVLTGEVLLANDTDADGDTITALAETVTTTGGGTATIYEDGSFSYLPGVGDVSQTDTFTYRITDGTSTSSATVTVAIGSQAVWYVDSAASTTGADGRSASPFTSLAPVNGANPATDADAPGHLIFVRTGAGQYAGGLALEADQQLVGEAEALVIGGVTVVSAGTTAPVITNTAGNGLTLANNVQVRGVAITGASADGIRASGINNATVGTAARAVPVAGSGGDGIELAGGNGAITLHTIVTGSVDRTVAISGRTGGTVALPGPSTGPGVELSNNSGATIAFSGPLSIVTTSRPAFTATGGGSVTATAPTSTLTSTTGTALTIDSTTIGAAHLTFRSVSANGASNGIRLNATGNAGGLRVLGAGTTTQGGDASGGTIRATTGPGVSLTTTQDVRLNNLSILDVPTAAGIKGTAVNGLMFTNGRIDGSGLGGNDNTAANVAFNTIQDAPNLVGAVTITNSLLQRAYGSGVDIYNRSGTISSLTLSDNLIESTTSAATSLGSAVLVQALGTGAAAAGVQTGTISGNTVRNFPNGGGLLLYGGNGTGPGAPAGTFGTLANPVAVTGNSVQGNSAAPMNLQCIRLQMAGVGSGAINLTNNGTVGTPLGNNRGNCLSINSTGAFALTSRVTGNVVAPGASHIPGAHAIAGGTTADPTGLDAAVLDVIVSNNNVINSKGVGIDFLASGRGTLRIRVEDNMVAAPSTTTGNAGIVVESGNGAPGSDSTVCLQISGNTTEGSPHAQAGGKAPGIGVRKEGTVAATNEFGIVGLTPSPADQLQTAGYVSSLNPASVPGTPNFGGVGGTYVINGSNFTTCSLPI